jgi:dienelactone hydrolase
MSPRAHRQPRPILLLVVWFAGCAGAPAGALSPQAPAPVTPVRPPSGLEPLPWGARPVGFRQELLTDPTRRYGWQSRAETQTSRAPRPILMNVWYPAAAPATGAPMTVAGYLQVPGNPAVEPAFPARLSRHVRQVLLAETVGVRAPAAQVDALLARPTLARRDAPVAAGTFPVVLYHPGLGGAFADNLVLAELLASHGHLVVSSAYQPDQQLALGIDWDIEGSILDLQFLLAVLRGNSSVDWSRLAVMGHSYGAQAVLAFAMRNGLVDAVVSLDSTIENMSPEHTQQAGFAYHFDDGERLRAPLLLFSTEHARNRRFLESLVWSDRTYVSLTGMNHNDFIAHGGALTRGLLPGYATVCRAVVAFLDARLRGPKPAGDPFAAIARAPGVKLERLPARPGYKSTDDVVRAAIIEGESSVEQSCRANVCGLWLLAEAVAQLTAGGQVELAQRLLNRVASLLPPFSVELERAGIAEQQGKLAEARARLLEARRLLAREKRIPAPVAQHFGARLARALRQLEPPGEQ